MTGMPMFHMVGLLSSEVQEAKERVRTSMRNSGYSLPYNRITVNLSPADRRKEGTAFDLPIAIALLGTMDVLPAKDLPQWMVVGELGLNGEVKPVHGILPMVMMAKKDGISYCMVPKKNEAEGKLVPGIRVIAVDTLAEAVGYIQGSVKVKDPENADAKAMAATSNQSCKNEKDLQEDAQKDAQKDVQKDIQKDIQKDALKDVQIHLQKDIQEDFQEDFKDILGNTYAKEASVIAAAGRHHLLLLGAPGTGKSMIASRIPGIMPALTKEEQLEITGIYSISGDLGEEGLIRSRPFRSPHHSTTVYALVGGGKNPKPGELTLAHRGVLFLDELAEFPVQVLDALREPLEEKKIRIIRTGGRYEFPADCLFVGAMNPCKCGYYPDRSRCRCSILDVRNYLGKISGPLLDRMDLCVEVSRQKLGMHMDETEVGRHDSAYYRRRVARAVRKQFDRNGGIYNSQLKGELFKQVCRLDEETTKFMEEAYDKFGLSMRAYYKVIKVARTIADLEASELITLAHVSKALGYRMDRIFKV